MDVSMFPHGDLTLTSVKGGRFGFFSLYLMDIGCEVPAMVSSYKCHYPQLQGNKSL